MVVDKFKAKKRIYSNPGTQEVATTLRLVKTKVGFPPEPAEARAREDTRLPLRMKLGRKERSGETLRLFISLYPNLLSVIPAD